MRYRFLLTVTLALSLYVPSAARATTLALDPVGGGVSGTPGTVVGWGFVLFNSTDYVLVSQSEFVSATNVGTYTDFISSNQSFVVGPSPESDTWSQSFDATSGTGVGMFLIDPALTGPAHADGVILLTYDLYSVSPNSPDFNPDTDLISSGNSLSASASIDVLAPVPEPALGFRVALVCLGICVAGRKSRGWRSPAES